MLINVEICLHVLFLQFRMRNRSLVRCTTSISKTFSTVVLPKQDQSGYSDSLFCASSLFNYRKLRTPTPESTVLHVGCLTRNVNEAHLKEIFGMFALRNFLLDSTEQSLSSSWFLVFYSAELLCIYHLKIASVHDIYLLCECTEFCLFAMIQATMVKL